MNDETKQYIDRQIREHTHKGSESRRVLISDIFGAIPSNINVLSATIPTTDSNTDIYVIAPISGSLISADFSAVDALAASDTDYVTWTITNLGQAGAGTVAMLAASDANTTKATGGTAIAANTKRQLTLHGTADNTRVVEGDRLRIRVDATVATALANTVTFPTYMLRFI